MDVTVIGGGIAGLALAHQLAPDHDVTVLEGTTTGPVPAVAATEGAAVPGEQGAAGAQ